MFTQGLSEFFECTEIFKQRQDSSRQAYLMYRNVNHVDLKQESHSTLISVCNAICNVAAYIMMHSKSFFNVFDSPQNMDI